MELRVPILTKTANSRIMSPLLVITLRDLTAIRARCVGTAAKTIHGQILGLVGCGAIARMTARKAQGFGIRIIGYDPYLDQSLAEECNIELVSLTGLLKESDFISIHTPLNKETWHLIGESEFKQMKSTRAKPRSGLFDVPQIAHIWAVDFLRVSKDIIMVFRSSVISILLNSILFSFFVISQVSYVLD